MIEGQLYVLTCDVNGKQYIGQTIRGIETRLSQHLYGNLVITRALKKYGIDEFTIQLIEGFDSQIALDEAEKLLIKDLDAISPNGYNFTHGGNGGMICDEIKKKISLSTMGEKNHFYGKVPSKEHRKKIGDGNRGKKQTEEHKRKISDAHIGKKNHFYGKKHSEETKKLMCEAKKRNPIKGENHHLYGKKLSIEHRKKLSEAKQGEKNNRYGVKLSEETKRKMSESHKKRLKKDI